MSLKIAKTIDGSNTLYDIDLDEYYHSHFGAYQESIHIFIKNGLQLVSKENLSVLEIGFGTGLNCLITMQIANCNKQFISYNTLDKFPVKEELIKELGYDRLLGLSYENVMLFHKLDWNKSFSISKYFNFRKDHMDIQQLKLDAKYDVIYFDAFSPEKHPEAWSRVVFAHLYEHMNNGGVISTYCAKGSIQRLLKDVGFMVETVEGPPGKREIIVARKY